MTYVARDAAGNRTAGSFTVTVTPDVTPPVLTVPANISVIAATVSGTVVNFTPTAIDAVDPAPVIVSTPASGSLFAAGTTTTVNVTATDSAMNQSSGSFTVTVAPYDVTPPVLTVPANVTASATSAAGAVVAYSAATATDNVTVTPTITYSKASGTVFSIGTTTVTVTAQDAAMNSSTGSFTVTVSDTTPPALTLPANITVLATSGDGAVVSYPAATATDNVTVSPTITYSQASGTFPIGINTVTVTATDAASNSSTGTFTITVRDAVPPRLVLLSPTQGESITDPEVVFRGRVTDDRAVGRVEVVLNGGAPLSVSPTTTTKDYSWTLTTVPSNGVNVATVTSFDRFNNKTVSIQVRFYFGNARPELARPYNGLLVATVNGTEASHAGLVNLTVTKTGAFTGKVTLNGFTKLISGVFNSDGDSLFGVLGDPTLAIVKPAKPAPIPLGSLSLKLDTGGLHKVTGTLTDGVAVAELTADQALYSALATPPPPLTSLSTTIVDPQTDKGRYTAIFQAGTNSGVVPKGDGHGLVTVSAAGVVKLVGKLPDGSLVSYSSTLSLNNVWPVYLPLYAKKGFITGKVVFNPNLTGSDASCAGMRWFKPAGVLAPKNYLAGWPAGIDTDFVASKFIPKGTTTTGSPPPANPDSALGVGLPGVSDVTVANILITLADGGLSVPKTNDASLSPLSKVTVHTGAAGVSGLKLTFVAATGAFSGSFIHPGTSKTVPFTGVVYQKTNSASGFFLYQPPTTTLNPTTPLSGAVGVDKK